MYFPAEINESLRSMAKFDLDIVHTFLDEFDRRRDKSDTRGLGLSKTSSSLSGSSRPATSRTATSSRSK